jgi:hypothetical protein
VHSGKPRAEQTVVLLASALAPECRPEARAGLNPNDPAEGMVHEAAAWADDPMLVGDLPFVAKLASRLVASHETAGLVKFQPVRSYASSAAISGIERSLDDPTRSGARWPDQIAIEVGRAARPGVLGPTKIAPLENIPAGPVEEVRAVVAARSWRPWLFARDPAHRRASVHGMRNSAFST